MIEVDKVKYYNKKEVAERLQCTVPTINNKIVKGNVRGYQFGRLLYYTEEQIKQLITVRPSIKQRDNDSKNNSNSKQ